MRVILRKNDSATSLLLFVYNNYYTRTTKDSLKLSSLLEIMRAFNKTETAIRMALSRAAKAGFLASSKQNGEVYYKLTEVGMEQIQVWNRGSKSFWSRYKLRFLDWDGSWHVVNLNFDESNKLHKATAIDEIESLGFAKMTSGMWISPYYLKESLTGIFGKYGIGSGAIELHGNINVHREMEQFLDEVFSIQLLRRQYVDFIECFEPKLKEAVREKNEGRSIIGDTALPVLHELGWNFYKISSADAALPVNLLTQWEGDKAAYIMNSFRELVLEPVYQYLESFD